MTEGPGAAPRKLADPGAKRQALKRYQFMTVYVKLRLSKRESKPRGEPMEVRAKEDGRNRKVLPPVCLSAPERLRSATATMAGDAMNRPCSVCRIFLDLAKASMLWWVEGASAPIDRIQLQARFRRV